MFRPYSAALMMLTMLPAISARYSVPPTSESDPSCSKKFFKVMGSAICPRSISRDARVEDSSVDGIGEMVGPQEVGHPVISVVVGEDGAEQRLLGFEVVRRGPEYREGLVVIADGAQIRRIGRRGRHETEPRPIRCRG